MEVKVKVKVSTHAWKGRKNQKGCGSREGDPQAPHIWTLKLPSNAMPLRSAHTNCQQLTPPTTSAAPWPRLLTPVFPTRQPLPPACLPLSVLTLNQ